MPSVEDEFGFAEVLLVSRQDLYGGKICAALDRQHPRDLFDIKLLLEDEGISRETFKAFLLSVKQGNPDWSLIDLPHVSELPAVQWKLKNLENMPERKHRAALERLEQVLEQF